MTSRNNTKENQEIFLLVPPKMTSWKKPITIIKKLWNIAFLAYLITESNIKAYVQPVVLFSMLSLASGKFATNSRLFYKDLAIPFLKVFFYIWLYVLHFDCSNQRSPDSVKEDKLNKPQRPIPSGRLTLGDMKNWYMVSTFLLVFISVSWLGGFVEAVTFMLETYVYDRVDGANVWWGKNLINALFYMTGQLGGIRVAIMSVDTTDISQQAYIWCGLLALNTFSTIQIQDLRDQEGDQSRGRRTMPLVIGDRLTRWITSLLIIVWSLVCPAYWEDDCFSASWAFPVLVGSYLGVRILTLRTVQADRISFHFYTLAWIPALYAIPLLSEIKLSDQLSESFMRAFQYTSQA